MHSFWIRANAVFFFGLGVLGLLAGFNVMTVSYLIPDQPPIVRDLSVSSLRRLHKFRRTHDRAVVELSIDLDFEPVWNWNVKQIFVFVMAEYKGTVNRVNRVVLFDKIIEHDDPKKLVAPSVVKYPLVDESDDLRDVSITLKLGYDIHPLFGPLSLYGTGRKIIPFSSPNEGTYNYTFPTVYN